MAQIYPDPIDQLRPGELVFPIRVSHVVTRNKKRKQDSGGKHFCLRISEFGHPNPSRVLESPNFASASRDVPVQPVAEAISPAPTLAGVDTSPFPAFASEDVVLSERFEYVVEDGDIHGTILGNKQFQRCEDEPIHIPGAIQSFGFLIALEFGVMDQRRACIASENCAEMCSYSPLDLFRMDNAMDMFSDFHRNVFDKKIRYLQYQYHMNPGSHIAEPIVFQTSIRSQSGEEYPLICALHIVDRSPPLLVCEFERLAALQPYKEFDPELALYSLNSQESSTIRATSEMLELQRLVYSVQQDGGSTTETVNIMSNIQKQFSSCQNLQELLDCIVMVVQQLTAFHKVMVYQFDNYFNGKVAAEIVAADEDIARYRGLHFPAADIPPQARKLYQINRFRLLFDRDKPTARLVHCNQAGLGSVAPLDLTHSYLRAMSPVHIKYLENMQVRSTASISLDINGVLWGLIACHSYGPTGINIPFSVRTICYWIGLCASNCIENLASREKLETRVVFESISASHPPQECITASSADILKLFRANSGFIVINGEVRTLGKHEAYREAFLVLQFINLCKFEKVTLTENLANDYPDFVFAPILQTVAGFLFIPLSSSTDYIIFLRDHQRREVNWAGNPHKTETLSGSSLLQPRASFQKWTEVVSGTCREWSNLESKE
jgi:light-regulated signal transduction histidine kinase (bacteriophytochrome)